MHCFVVPIRDDDGNDLPGVTTSDCHYKGGLPGVDNGRIQFDHVRVPRENLLNKYADVAEDGTYSSPIENPNRRFFTMLGTLIRGRVTVGGSAGAAARVALDIADPICVGAQAVRGARRRGRSADHGLPGASAPAVPADRQVLRAAVRAERTGGQVPRTADRRTTPTPRSSASWSPGRRG